MSEYLVTNPVNIINYNSWQFEGSNLFTSVKKLGDLTGVFEDREAFQNMDMRRIVYEVQSHLPVDEGTAGGLFMGTTVIHPGKVGSEYFMTRGHYHAIENRCEYYWGIQGEGVLIRKNRNGEIFGEKVFPGSLHFINAHTAHRVANVGKTKLIFAACWPSDAGHNYEEIEDKGFGVILIDENGKPKLIGK
jgi:glucose-6-phosphate isomerase